MSDGAPDLVIEPSGELSDELRAETVRAFGRDGAWLLLSAFLYGWRSHYDLAIALMTGTEPSPVSDGRPSEPGDEFQMVSDLHVQALIFAAAEHYLGLIHAARQHDSGSPAFFDAYVGLPSISKLAETLGDVTREQIADLVGEPPDLDAVARELADYLNTRDPSPVLDPARIDTTEVAGLHLPRSFIDREFCERTLARSRELVDLMVSNVHELREQLLDPASDMPPGGPRPQPLREIDNSYRHGQRIFFHGAVPESRRFRSVGEAPTPSQYFVDLYLPHGHDTVKYGSVDCSPERTREHLGTLRQICTRIGQFLRSFVGHQALGHSKLLLAAPGVELPPPPDPLSEGADESPPEETG